MVVGDGTVQWALSDSNACNKYFFLHVPVRLGTLWYGFCSFNGKLNITGDLHGNLAALLAIESAIWPSGPALTPARLLFLGDFIDRGPHGTELLAYLLAAKLQRPGGIFMIRGNHETRDIQKMFTFYT